MIRVSIAAPYPTTRAGLRAVVSASRETEVVSEAGSVGELIEQAESLAPDAVLLDPGDESDVWLAAIWQLSDARTLPPVVMLVSNLTAMSETLQSLSGGLLRRDATVEEIGVALQAAALGLVVLDSGTVDYLVSLIGSEPEAPMLAESEALLTTRERDVLRLIARGMPNKTIAVELGISEHTVKFHVSSILVKLGASSRAEALARAAHAGIIAL